MVVVPPYISGGTILLLWYGTTIWWFVPYRVRLGTIPYITILIDNLLIGLDRRNTTSTIPPRPYHDACGKMLVYMVLVPYWLVVVWWYHFTSLHQHQSGG